MDKVAINTEFIKLGQLLKFASIVGNGSDAKMLIADGIVLSLIHISPLPTGVEIAAITSLRAIFFIYIIPLIF